MGAAVSHTTSIQRLFDQQEANLIDVHVDDDAIYQGLKANKYLPDIFTQYDKNRDEWIQIEELYTLIDDYINVIESYVPTMWSSTLFKRMELVYKQLAKENPAESILYKNGLATDRADMLLALKELVTNLRRFLSEDPLWLETEGNKQALAEERRRLNEAKKAADKAAAEASKKGLAATSRLAAQEAHGSKKYSITVASKVPTVGLGLGSRPNLGADSLMSRQPKGGGLNNSSMQQRSGAAPLLPPQPPPRVAMIGVAHVDSVKLAGAGHRRGVGSAFGSNKSGGGSFGGGAVGSKGGNASFGNLSSFDSFDLASGKAQQQQFQQPESGTISSGMFFQGQGYQDVGSLTEDQHRVLGLQAPPVTAKEGLLTRALVLLKAHEASCGLPPSITYGMVEKWKSVPKHIFLDCWINVAEELGLSYAQVSRRVYGLSVSSGVIKSFLTYQEQKRRAAKEDARQRELALKLGLNEEEAPAAVDDVVDPGVAVAVAVGGVNSDMDNASNNNNGNNNNNVNMMNMNGESNDADVYIASPSQPSSVRVVPITGPKDMSSSFSPPPPASSSVSSLQGMSPVPQQQSVTANGYVSALPLSVVNAKATTSYTNNSDNDDDDDDNDDDDGDDDVNSDRSSGSNAKASMVRVSTFSAPAAAAPARTSGAATPGAAAASPVSSPVSSIKVTASSTAAAASSSDDDDDDDVDDNGNNASDDDNAVTRVSAARMSTGSSSSPAPAPAPVARSSFTAGADNASRRQSSSMTSSMTQQAISTAAAAATSTGGSSDDDDDDDDDSANQARNSVSAAPATPADADADADAGADLMGRESGKSSRRSSSITSTSTATSSPIKTVDGVGRTSVSMNAPADPAAAEDDDGGGGAATGPASRRESMTRSSQRQSVSALANGATIDDDNGAATVESSSSSIKLASAVQDESILPSSLPIAPADPNLSLDLAKAMSVAVDEYEAKGGVLSPRDLRSSTASLVSADDASTPATTAIASPAPAPDAAPDADADADPGRSSGSSNSRKASVDIPILATSSSGAISPRGTPRSSIIASSSPRGSIINNNISALAAVAADGGAVSPRASPRASLSSSSLSPRASINAGRRSSASSTPAASSISPPAPASPTADRRPSIARSGSINNAASPTSPTSSASPSSGGGSNAPTRRGSIRGSVSGGAAPPSLRRDSSTSSNTAATAAAAASVVPSAPPTPRRDGSISGGMAGPSIPSSPRRGSSSSNSSSSSSSSSSVRNSISLSTAPAGVDIAASSSTTTPTPASPPSASLSRRPSLTAMNSLAGLVGAASNLAPRAGRSSLTTSLPAVSSPGGSRRSSAIANSTPTDG